MKELSIEEKAKAYDNIIEKANKMHNENCEACQMCIEELIPELKESDEMIRKVLLDFLKNELERHGDEEWDWGFHTTDMIAWLEKQGEQKPADKVEPKFKPDDWVVNKFGDVWHIDSFDKKNYQVSNGNEYNYFPISKQDEMHLWTIQDAKDGDELTYVTDEEDLWIMIYWSLYEPYEGHVHYHALLVNNNFSDKGTCCISIDNLKPATKEQRDTLERAITNAGYRWDKEKLKLEKL